MSRSVMKLLFLNGEYTHTVDVIRQLKKHISAECHVVVNNRMLFCKSKYVDSVHYLNPEGIDCEVERLNNRYGFDYIIPVGYPEVEILSRMKDNLGNILVSEPAVIENCIYKKRTLKIADGLGIPVPWTRAVEHLGDLDEMGLHYPVFIKNSKERGGGYRAVADSTVELKMLCERIFEQDDQALIQEYISSPYTYGVGFNADGGKLTKYYIHKEIMSLPPSGGSGVLLEGFSEPVLVEYTERLINALRYSGMGLAEYKYCEKRRDYVLMEINSKLWASIVFALQHMPDLLPFIKTVESDSSEVDSKCVFLFIDKFIRSLKYERIAPVIQLVKYFAFSPHRKRVNFEMADIKYELFQLLKATMSLLPEIMKKQFRRNSIKKGILSAN